MLLPQEFLSKVFEAQQRTSHSVAVYVCRIQLEPTQARRAPCASSYNLVYVHPTQPGGIDFESLQKRSISSQWIWYIPSRSDAPRRAGPTGTSENALAASAVQPGAPSRATARAQPCRHEAWGAPRAMQVRASRARRRVPPPRAAAPPCRLARGVAEGVDWKV